MSKISWRDGGGTLEVLGGDMRRGLSRIRWRDVGWTEPERSGLSNYSAGHNGVLISKNIYCAFGSPCTHHGYQLSTKPHILILL